MSMNRLWSLGFVVVGASALLVPGCASSGSQRTASDRGRYGATSVRVGEVVYVRDIEMPLEPPAAVPSGDVRARTAVTRSKMDVMGKRVDAKMQSLPSQRRAGSGTPSASDSDVATVPGVEISVEMANGDVVVVMQPIGEETFEIGDSVHVLLRDDGGAIVLQ